MSDNDAVICAYVRSPFTPATKKPSPFHPLAKKKKGPLDSIRADDLMAQVIKGLVDRTQIVPAKIEDVIIGCAFPEGEQGMNVARISSLLAELPYSVPGMTVNRFCGSSMEAIISAAGKIATNGGDVFICGGVESMSHIPMGGNGFSGNEELANTSGAYVPMGYTADYVAQRYDISRKDQEEFALRSHRNAAKADFSKNIIPIILPNGRVVEKDGCIRPDTSLGRMAKLPPAFDRNGTVTAATSSPETDGAVAVLVCSEKYARKNGLPMLARLKSHAVSGVKPEEMGIGPIEASRKALERAEIDLKDIDFIELNEAFASQALAVVRALGLELDKVNVDGGAIALGHPLGASGGRITGQLVTNMDKRKKKLGLATMCIGGGQGIATVWERPEEEKQQEARKIAEEIIGKDSLPQQIDAIAETKIVPDKWKKVKLVAASKIYEPAKIAVSNEELKEKLYTQDATQRAILRIFKKFESKGVMAAASVYDSSLKPGTPQLKHELVITIDGADEGQLTRLNNALPFKGNIEIHDNVPSLVVQHEGKKSRGATHKTINEASALLKDHYEKSAAAIKSVLQQITDEISKKAERAPSTKDTFAKAVAGKNELRMAR